MPNKIVEQISRSSYKVGVAITGGGASFLGDLLSLGGCSDFFAFGTIPYGMEDLKDFLGKEPSYSYCSRETAREMAVTARGKVEKNYREALGLGVTASLCKAEGEREGRENKMFVCVSTAFETVEHEFFFEEKNREVQEKAAAYFILMSLKNFCSHGPIDRFILDENVDTPFSVASNYSNQVLTTKKFDFHKLDELDSLNKDNLFVYSGSFNPIHDGHVNIINKCLEMNELGPTILEVCTGAYQKISLDHLSIKERLDNIRSKVRYGVVVLPNDQGYFVDKYEKYRKFFSNKKIVFVIGDDVFFKITEYCKKKGKTFSELFNQAGIDHTQMQFLVFPRLQDNIEYTEDQKKFIHEETFNLKKCDYSHGMSSTKIRKCLH